MPPEDVEEQLKRFLTTVHVSECSQQSIAGIGMEEVEIVRFDEGKRKQRDAEKKHQGFALVRFERASMVELACKALAGLDMGAGARGCLTASIARARVEMEQAQKEKEEQEARKKQAKIEAQRAHNLSQKRRRVERMENELESIFGSMASPGGKHAIKSWRCLQAKVGIDWEKIPAECDPYHGGGLGPDTNPDRRKWSRRERPKEDTAAAAEARALRKRVQVESFYELLAEMLRAQPQHQPPPCPLPLHTASTCETLDTASTSETIAQRWRVVDFGCGTGNLTLPLAGSIKALLIEP
jgi:2-polyprenyl-3-methyl-5-hydroxy-6-metoxy-1,4-benzoquinol methylase